MMIFVANCGENLGGYGGHSSFLGSRNSVEMFLAMIP